MRIIKYNQADSKCKGERLILNKLFFLIMISFFASKLQAQDRGIHFDHNASWNTILTKAKAENKYIFVDCYTTWCGPCKYMDASVFPMEEVGNFFNDKFISVKFQIDTTANDTEKIKGQYKDAAFIKREYKVNGYPTYLFFNLDGELVHEEGGSSNADEFIAFLKDFG